MLVPIISLLEQSIKLGRLAHRELNMYEIFFCGVSGSRIKCCAFQLFHDSSR